MPNFGYIPSTPDHRDFIYGQMVAGIDLPPSFFYPRISVNKQIIGDCVGQSSRSIKAIQEKTDFSPDFVYSECKKLDGIPDQEGTQPRVAMQVLQKIGAARKGLYSDLTSNANRPEPSPQAIEDAKGFQIGSYARVQTVEEIKHALYTQGPVMGAVIVTQSFVDAPGGVIPNPEGNILGGHAICIDGYDEKQLRFVNSWGEEWGDHGYGYLPYSYLTYTTDLGMRFFSEAWASMDIIVPGQETTEIILQVGSETALVNGSTVILDQGPVIQNDRALVPIRFVAERMGFTVDYDNGKITIRR